MPEIGKPQESVKKDISRSKKRAKPVLQAAPYQILSSKYKEVMQNLNNPVSSQHEDFISESDSYSDDCGGSGTDGSQFSEDSGRQVPGRPRNGYKKNQTSLGLKGTNVHQIDFIQKNKQILDARAFRLGASPSPTKPRVIQEQPPPVPTQIPNSAVLSPKSNPHHPQQCQIQAPHADPPAPHPTERVFGSLMTSQPAEIVVYGIFLR